MASNSKKGKGEAETASDNPPEIPISLEGVIEESREKLAGEDLPAPKKKRGRPTKAEAELKAQANENERRESAAVIAAQLTPALKFAVAMPFDYAVKRTGFSGYALSSEEKDALASQLDAVLNQYLPQIPSQHAPLIVFSTSLILLSIGKIMEHYRWQSEKESAKQSENVPLN